MVPHTDDGRVLFAIPWHNRVIVGTTETPVNVFPLEPIPQKDEIDFLLTHTARYLTKDQMSSDILSVFTGLRPLVKSGNEENTAAISRDHTISISRSGLITITGGKWTTYRKMAEDTIDQAYVLAQLDPQKSVSAELQIHGYHKHADEFGDLAIYGSDAPRIQELINEDNSYKEIIHPSFKTVAGEVIWSVRFEMTRTVEDFISRRTRMLLIDTKAAIKAAPKVAALIAKELNKDNKWIAGQVKEFTDIASNYIVKEGSVTKM
jgi:glycerol-3-phosphate dehydrogenase